MSEPIRPEDVAAQNERSLSTLARAIALSQGRFSLILVRCNYRYLRERMVEQLRERCVGAIHESPLQIRELVLPEFAKKLYAKIEAEVGDEQPDALMVLGLESVTAIDDLLTSTNQVRDEFRKSFSFPLVLWVNDEVLQKLVRLARDFHSWAGASIKFAIATDELIEFLQQEADELFTKVLKVGAERFVDNAALNIGMGAGKRFELESALKELQSRGCHEPALEAAQQFILGRDAYANNQMEQAQELYEQSLAFWQQNHDLERQACLLFHLGLLWRKHAVLHQAEYKTACGRAREYYQQCVEILQQANRTDLAARFINALGEVLLQLEQWEELETVAASAVELHQTYPNSFRLAYAYGFLAEVALAKSAWSEAKQYAQTALNTHAQSSESGDDSQNQDTDFGWLGQHYQSWYHLLLAQAQRHLGQVPEALQNLETAKVECKHEYNPQLYLLILEELRSLYFEQGRYLEAFNLKQEQLRIKQEYGLRSFIGAGRLEPQRHVIHPTLVGVESSELDTHALPAELSQATIAQEIVASGRQQDVDRLVERISRDDHKLIVIHGPSGVGKSSLLTAGLVPELHQKATIDGRNPLPVVVRVYTDWVLELGATLEKALGEVKDIRLSATPDSLEVIVEQLRKNVEHHLLTVLIFDQFEEFFFNCSKPAERQKFWNFLHVCLDSVKIPYVKVILSLREDYLHYLLEGDRLTNLEITKNDILNKEIRYPLGNFSPEDARAVIQDLTQGSFYLEPALIDELVLDLAGESGEVRPIELQIVGAQLQEEKITTLAEYRCLGSNSKAELVERYLAEVIKDCGSEENRKVAQLSLYFLTDENGIRPLKTRAELEIDLEAAGLKSEADKLDLVLEVLVGTGLVLLVPEAPTDRYQLFHDYLVAFIRQQQAPGLLAELAAAKEKQKQTQEQLRQTLKQLEQALHQEQQERKRAEITEIEALSSLSQALLLSHDQLGALVASVKAGKKLLETEAPTDIKLRTVDRLRQAVYVLQERNRFQGHSAGVLSIAFSPDGQMIATASADKTVKLWHLDGTQLYTFQHKDLVRGVRFSPDGKTLISVSEDKTLKLWNLDGTEVQTCQVDSDWVIVVSFSHDSQMIATASEDKIVKLWQIDGTEVQTLHGHSARVRGVSFSPDGKTLATASDDKTVKLWQLNGTEVQTLHGHSARVRGVSFSPDGKTLATASDDKTVKLWQLNGTQVQTFQHSDWVTSVYFSPDGEMIATVSKDKTVKLWRLDGTEVQTFQHNDWVRSVSFSPDGKTLATASEDKTLRLWRLDNTLLKTLSGHSSIVTSVSFSLLGEMIATGSEDATLRLWHVDGTKPLQTFQGHSAKVWNVSFSPDGRTLASASQDRTAKLWCLDGTQLQTFHHNDWVWYVSFSPDGQMIATASADKTVKLWCLDGTEVRTLQHNDWVRVVRFSPDGNTLVSACADNTMKLWRLDGTQLQTFLGHSDWIWDVSFSPDGQMIASASDDKTVKLWRLDGTELQTFQGHSARVWGVSFSPDGQMIASGSEDKTVKLWRLDGTELQTFQHKDRIWDVSFSPDGQMIAFASEDKMVKLWHLDDTELQTSQWNLNLDAFLVRSCNWVRDYLKNNPNVSESDRHLCDGIGIQK